MSDLYIKKDGLLYSPDGQTIIGVDDTSGVFSGHVPYGAKYIDDEVFSECPYESVVLPDSIKELGVSLFKDSKILESVKLPVFLTQLPVELFSGCSALTKVIMPNEIIGFSEGLFQGCESLTEIPFRAGVSYLPANVFAGCTSLKSLVIPDSVENIENGAVANCTNLESIVFPSGLKYIAPGAFDGCVSIHNIRINGDSSKFFVNEDDGCLYMKTTDGNELVVKSYKVDPTSVSYFEEDVESQPIEDSDDYEDENQDDLFSSEVSEIGADDAEVEAMGISDDFNSDVPEAYVSEEEKLAFSDSGINTEGDSEIEKSANSTVSTDSTEFNEVENNEACKPEKSGIEGDMMSDENNVDSMLADIMGEEKARTSVSENVGVSEAESEVLSETLSVMEDSSMSNGVSVTLDELEKLSSKQEEQEMAAQEEQKDKNELDSKTKILVDSAEVNKILMFNPAQDDREDGDLFVVAEKLVPGEDGNMTFTKHLEACCSRMAMIHDFSRVVMLYNLPVDNDEFMQFYRHFMGKRNIILACEAEKPSALSDYCKTVCDNSRISLDSKEINEQRKYASVKTETLVKLVVRDKYED